MSESIQSARGFAEVYGAKLYNEVTGTGHPLVLLHEGIADSRMYDAQFHAFAQRYRVVRFDLRGFGQSDLPPGDKRVALHEDTGCQRIVTVRSDGYCSSVTGNRESLAR